LTGSRLRALGATQIVHDVTAAAGHYDLVLESTGGESLPAAMAKLADRGTAIWFGQASKTPPTLDFFSFLSGPWSVTLRIFHYTDSGLSFRDDLTTLVRLTATGRLHPEAGLTTGWQDTADVLVRLRDRGIRGNAVLTI
jgi:NADPH2:quinone reductase